MAEVSVDRRAAITVIATPTSTCLKPMLKASGRRTGGIDKNADSAGHQEAHQQHEVRERPMVAGWYADLSAHA